MGVSGGISKGSPEGSAPFPLAHSRDFLRNQKEVPKEVPHFPLLAAGTSFKIKMKSRGSPSFCSAYSRDFLPIRKEVRCFPFVKNRCLRRGRSPLRLPKCLKYFSPAAPENFSIFSEGLPFCFLGSPERKSLGSPRQSPDRLDSRVVGSLQRIFQSCSVTINTQPGVLVILLDLGRVH